MVKSILITFLLVFLTAIFSGCNLENQKNRDDLSSENCAGYLNNALENFKNCNNYEMSNILTYCDFHTTFIMNTYSMKIYGDIKYYKLSSSKGLNEKEIICYIGKGSDNNYYEFSDINGDKTYQIISKNEYDTKMKVNYPCDFKKFTEPFYNLSGKLNKLHKTVTIYDNSNSDSSSNNKTDFFIEIKNNKLKVYNLTIETEFETYSHAIDFKYDIKEIKLPSTDDYIKIDNEQE